jgi:hypothetical protein
MAIRTLESSHQQQENEVVSVNWWKSVKASSPAEKIS